MFANCILFVTFCSMGTLVRGKKIWRYSARKVLEFGLLMRDIPVYVSCKFEIYIFKIALVISENVRIAFLYVLSIYNEKESFLGYLLTKQNGCPTVKAFHRMNLNQNKCLNSNTASNMTSKVAKPIKMAANRVGCV